MISDIAFAMLRTRERPHSSATLLFFNDTPTTEIYTLSLHDALPISNPGVFGGLFGLPVISQPNVGILGLGAIEKRPVVINDSIAIRSMCYVTLSYDHRVVDGAIAHQFLHKVKETLENWNEPVL